MVPAAPGLFSTTTGCPSASCKAGAMSRAVTSTFPPAEKGTMMRIGLEGKACAAASVARLAARAARARLKDMFMELLHGVIEAFGLLEVREVACVGDLDHAAVRQPLGEDLRKGGRHGDVVGAHQRHA